MIRVAEQAEADGSRKPRGIQDMALGRSDLLRMDPRDLHVEKGWNVRIRDFDPEDEDDLALAKSIAENGVRQPLTVYVKNGLPTLTDGHRRLAAAIYALDHLGASFPSVPVQTEVKGADEAERVLSMETRNGGKQLAPIERAALYSRLVGLGRDEAWIAQRTGRSRQYVINLLSLREGPSEVVRMVEAGEVSATLAMSTLRETKDDAAATEKLTEAVSAAKAAGRTKVTAKHLRPKAAPGAEVVAVARNHPTFQAGLRRAAEIARQGGHEDAAAMIEVEIAG